MAIQLMGCPTNLGMPGSEVRRGPAALRTRGLLELLHQSTLQVADLGDLALPDAPAERGQAGLLRVEEAAALQRARVAGAYRAGDLLLTIGGDHSAAVGSISGLRSLGEQFDLIWIDAHGDFNSPGTSPSGNVHGMALAMLCGYAPGSREWLDGRRVSILGARDLDPGEVHLLQHAGVRTLSPANTMARLESFVGTTAPRVFISFDLDSLDPAIAPGVSTPSTGGFSLSEALSLVATIARRSQIVGLDLVEYNPAYDKEGSTADAALAVIRTVLSSQVERPSPSDIAAV